MQSCPLLDLWYQARMHVPHAASASGDRSSCGKHAKERKRSQIVHHCCGGVSRKCITFTCTSPYRLEYRVLRKRATHGFAYSIPRTVRDARCKIPPFHRWFNTTPVTYREDNYTQFQRHAWWHASMCVQSIPISDCAAPFIIALYRATLQESVLYRVRITPRFIVRSREAYHGFLRYQTLKWRAR